MATGADVVERGRSYLGTPFLHAGRVPGLALDCAGVWICAARDLRLVSTIFDVPEYSGRPDGHTLIEWCDRWMGPRVAESDIMPGHGIVFATDRWPQHLGIAADYYAGGLSIIHADNKARPPRVLEQRLLFSQALRFVAAYAFPGVE